MMWRRAWDVSSGELRPCKLSLHSQEPFFSNDSASERKGAVNGGYYGGGDCPQNSGVCPVIDTSDVRGRNEGLRPGDQAMVCFTQTTPRGLRKGVDKKESCSNRRYSISVSKIQAG